MTAPIAAPSPPLGDDTVTLRPWTHADVPALRAACGDEAICSFSTVPWRYTPAEARAWVDRQEEKRREGRGITLAVVPTGETSPLGTVVLTALDSAQASARLGYWLVGPGRGRGYATPAARLLADWSLRELGLTRIELIILPANTASRRVAESLGAIDMGLHPELAQNGDRRADAQLYRIDA